MVMSTVQFVTFPEASGDLRRFLKVLNFGHILYWKSGIFLASERRDGGEDRESDMRTHTVDVIDIVFIVIRLGHNFVYNIT